MKKTILLNLVMLLILPFGIKAQWLLTGNTPGPANFLGSTNNTQLNFRTNNVQRMNLRAGNNLTSPPYTFGNNTGYLALGTATFNTPLFHLSVQTPANANYGELLFGASPSDVPNSYAALINC